MFVLFPGQEEIPQHPATQQNHYQGHECLLHVAGTQCVVTRALLSQEG